MEDDSQPFDPTQWDYDDLDFCTPQLRGTNTCGVSLADPSPSPSSHQRSRLPLLQLDDWDPDDTYDECPPTSVHYSIEWKLQLRKGRLSKLTNDTEQNLVLAPGAFYLPEETIVVVSVTDRSERDLTKRFDEFDIDWQMAAEQLCKWSPLFRAGKKLRIDISFICNELRTHRDVPPYILDMIYEKDRLDVDLTDLVIPKPIDRAVDDYTEWLCDQVEEENWKAGFRSAGSITRADCLDLRHVYQDRDIGYYVNQGVKAGIARSFVQDIKIWADSL
ncbi:unnamed protein product [Fusarium graminearum]|nr:unnamed protein product [Fusarium graminearum]CAG1987530.1 unnamed protein product [Fusarium graminearum]CAG1997959.1 unnamed protein product [Fusarium graminearum]